MVSKNCPQGCVEIFFTRELFNSLVSFLEIFIKTGDDNNFCIYAKKLKRKMLKYSRILRHNDEEKVSTYFYESESSVLIKMISLYINATENNNQDYFSLIGKVE